MSNKLKIASTTRIYLDMRRLLDVILDCIPDFPKDFKVVIGARMQDLCVSMLNDLSCAYLDKPRRYEHLVDFQCRFDTLRTLVRISGERRWLRGLKRHALIVDLLDAVGRQSNAWKNSLSESQTAGSLSTDGHGCPSRH